MSCLNSALATLDQREPFDWMAVGVEVESCFARRFEVEEVKEREKSAGSLEGNRLDRCNRVTESENHGMGGMKEVGAKERRSKCSFEILIDKGRNHAKGHLFSVSLSVHRRKRRLRTTVVRGPRMQWYSHDALDERATQGRKSLSWMSDRQRICTIRKPLQQLLHLILATSPISGLTESD